MAKPVPKRVYSYVRFSTPQQAEGGSASRQAALSQAYCERKKLTLDDSLTLRDLGVSAFRGDNVRDGALAGFLEACRMGRVIRGSVLIVESLDRLSRDQIRPALQLFLALQDFGITIVTMEPEREYLPDSTDALALIEPLIIFARAHEESAIKSHRRRDGWKQARARARQGNGPMMKTCPSWVEVTRDGFRLKEPAATVVRQIFGMAMSGLGTHRITAKLTREQVPAIGDKGRWLVAYVYRILTSPAAMGTYQPNRQEGKGVVPDGEPIVGYYPAVVSEQVWREAQAAIRSRGNNHEENGRFRKGGPAPRGAGRKGVGDGETNLFTGIVHDAMTGDRMQIVMALGSRVTNGVRKRYTYLAPSRETGSPKIAARIDYDVFESAILSQLRELNPGDLIDGPAPSGRAAEVGKLSGRLLDIDNRLERAQQRARTANDFDAFLDLIQELQTERRQVAERMAALHQEEAGQPGVNLGEAHSLIDLLQRTPDDQRNELRRRLKSRLRQLVEGVWLVIVARGNTRLCAAQVRMQGGLVRDYLIVRQTFTGYAAANNSPRTEVRSLADVACNKSLDLRKPRDAAALAKLLERVELETP